MNEISKALAQLLETANNGLKGVGGGIQSLSPEAWRIAVKQAYISAVSTTVTSALFAVVALVVIVGAAKIIIRREEGDDVGPLVAAVLVAVAVLLVCIFAIANVGIPGILNPEFAAAELILEKLRGN